MHAALAEGETSIKAMLKCITDETSGHLQSLAGELFDVKAQLVSEQQVRGRGGGGNSWFWSLSIVQLVLEQQVVAWLCPGKPADRRWACVWIRVGGLQTSRHALNICVNMCGSAGQP